MRPSWIIALACAASIAPAHAQADAQAEAPATAPAGPPADLKLPPGTRTNKDGQLVSGRGLRDATDFIAKDLAKRGVTATQIGPYRIRGVELTRFISQTESTSWMAIHVVRINGKTLISFVLRPNS